MQRLGIRGRRLAAGAARRGRAARRWPRLACALLLPIAAAASPTSALPPAATPRSNPSTRALPVRHTALQATYPAADSVHHGDVVEVRLRYSTAVQSALSTIALSGPGGPVAGVGAVEVVPGTEEREIRVRLPAPLPSGGYMVRWTTAGPDSHPLTGSFAFTVDRPELPASAAPVGEVAGTPGLTPTESQPESGMPARDPAGVFVRGVFLLSILGMLGAPIFRLAVLGPVAADPGLRGFAEEASRRAAAVAWGVAAALVLAVPARLLKQSADLFGADALQGASIARILGTGWGSAWVLQAAMAALFIVGLFATRRDAWRPSGWWMMLAAGLGSAAIPALSGHAAGTPGALRGLAVVNDAVHVTAAGAWMGTLAVLAIAGLGAAAALRSPLPAAVGGGWADPSQGSGSRLVGGPLPGGSLAPAARMVNAFSRAALLAVGALALTGLVSAWLQVGSVGALLGSGYGRTLLIKLALVGAAAGVGFYNWRVLRPALARGGDAGRIARSAKLEVLLGLGVVVVTAALIATPLP